MFVDLKHNKILSEIVTESFGESVSENLVPMLSDMYGDKLIGIQMYEDYIKDNFLKDGYWYYPLTVVLPGENRTLWIKWDVSDAASFDGGLPYAFVGDSLEFLIADDVPSRFEDALEGRDRYFGGDYIKVNVQTNAPAPTFLCGRYSQTFVDEMARQITHSIERTVGVEGLSDSGIELDLVFAPETYMEHTSENVTYRRLLMTAKGCSPRDFWVKWTRENSAVAYSVSDNVTVDDITFEIGEDVSHKVREKEYRFLVYGNSDKYRAAMGRKNITEWRELIKRAIKRGDLIKTATSLEEDVKVSEISDKLSEILAKCGVSVPEYTEVNEPVKTEDPEFERAMALARAAALGNSDESGYSESDYNDGNAEIGNTEPDGEFILDSEYVAPEAADTVEDFSFLYTDEVAEAAEDIDTLKEEDSTFDIPTDVSDEPYTEPEPVHVNEPEADAEDEYEPYEETEEQPEDIEIPVTVSTDSYSYTANSNDEELRRVQTEADILRREYEALLAENARLQREAKEAEKTRLIEQEARREQEAKLRERIDIESKERAREKLLFAEAARLVREENERMAKEKADAEAYAKAEAERLEKLRREEEERIAAEEARQAEIRRIEAEKAVAEQRRILAEREAALEEERKRREEEERRAAEQARIEELAKELAKKMAEERIEAERAAAAKIEEEKLLAERRQAELEAARVAAERAEAERIAASYTYTSKVVRLIFRHNVDPNVTARIHEMISVALSHFHKEHVYIRIKASIPEPSTVLLNFVKIPEEEMDLLVNIIKLLGNSDLGIAKAILE